MAGWDAGPYSGSGHLTDSAGRPSHEALYEYLTSSHLALDATAPNYGVVADGVTNDGPALRAAIADAESAGYGTVLLPPGIIRITTTETDANSDTCGLAIESSRVSLVGTGRGSARSGSSNAFGQTTILIDVACEHGIMFKSSNGNPDWRGGGIYGVHVQDGNDYITNDLLGIQGLLDFRILDVSLGGAGATDAKALRIFPANNGEPTQYGRCYNLDVWDCYHGIWLESNTTGNPVAPDWKFLMCQLQRPTTGTAPVAGTYGVYVNSNAFHLLFSEVQNFDTGVVIDCANNRGKHINLQGLHFEMHSGWDSNSVNAAIEIQAHTSSQNNNILIADCETPSPGKYKTDGGAPSGSIIKVTGSTPANVTGTRIRDFRIRDFGTTNAWLTTSNATSYIDGGGSWSCEINTVGSASSL